MKQVLFIGDIHGKLEIVQNVLSDKFKDYTKVFLGDFLDSFNRSPQDCFLSLKYAYEAAELRDNVHVIIGNHELSYTHSRMKASGWNMQTEALINASGISPIINNIGLRYFVIEHPNIKEPILISHAGVTLKHFSDNKEYIPSFDEVLEFLEGKDAFSIGRSRGGWHQYGGNFWCDWHDEFEPIPGIIQIVGHSSHRDEDDERNKIGILELDGNYNIDALDTVDEVLILNNEGEFLIRDLCEF